jgi:hypothetical protein
MRGEDRLAPQRTVSTALSPCYVRDAVVRSWRQLCHRAIVPRHCVTVSEAYLVQYVARCPGTSSLPQARDRRDKRDPRRPGRTTVSTIAAGGSYKMWGGCRQTFQDDFSEVMIAVGWGILRDDDFCMKIELRLSAPLSRYLPERRAGNLCSMEIPERTTLQGLLQRLAAPAETCSSYVVILR